MQVQFGSQCLLRELPSDLWTSGLARLGRGVGSRSQDIPDQSLPTVE